MWLIGFVALSPFLDELVRGDRFLRLDVRWQLVVSALLLWLMAARPLADFVWR